MLFRSPAPIPNIVFESLNRSDVEADFVNETGWFNLDDHRGSVIILDLMARDCSNCHLVQEHIEEEMEDWHATANASGKSLKIFAYGAWYDESVNYLNKSSGAYSVPLYPTGFGSTEAAVLEDDSTADPVRLFTTGGTGQIPVVLIIDEEGYIIAQQASSNQATLFFHRAHKPKDAVDHKDSDTAAARRCATASTATNATQIHDCLVQILPMCCVFHPHTINPKRLKLRTCSCKGLDPSDGAHP